MPLNEYPNGWCSFASKLLANELKSKLGLDPLIIRGYDQIRPFDKSWGFHS